MGSGLRRQIQISIWIFPKVLRGLNETMHDEWKVAKISMKNVDNEWMNFTLFGNEWNLLFKKKYKKNSVKRSCWRWMNDDACHVNFKKNPAHCGRIFVFHLQRRYAAHPLWRCSTIPATCCGRIPVKWPTGGFWTVLWSCPWPDPSGRNRPNWNRAEYPTLRTCRLAAIRGTWTTAGAKTVRITLPLRIWRLNVAVTSAASAEGNPSTCVRAKRFSTDSVASIRRISAVLRPHPQFRPRSLPPFHHRRPRPSLPWNPNPR